MRTIVSFVLAAAVIFAAFLVVWLIFNQPQQESGVSAATVPVSSVAYDTATVSELIQLSGDWPTQAVVLEFPDPCSLSVITCD